MKTVVGFLNTHDEAEDLVDDLVEDGFERSSIDIVRSGPDIKESFFDKIKNIFGRNTDAPREHAEYYAEGVRRGGVVVSVSVEDNEVDKCVDVMNDHDAVDIEQRAAQWKQSGWTGYNQKAKPFTPAQMEEERERVLPISEETVKVGKRMVPKGGVRVYTRVIEMPVQEQVTLREERAKIARRAVNRPASGEEAFKESTIEIHESAEEPVVSKEARVKEEVVVGKESTERTETVREKARRTELSVEGEDDFRKHFNTNYESLGGTYESYDPAYRYGRTIYSDKRYLNKDWPQIENDVRTDWEKKNPGTWDKFKGAIRYGWDRMRGRPVRKAA